MYEKDSAKDGPKGSGICLENRLRQWDWPLNVGFLASSPGSDESRIALMLVSENKTIVPLPVRIWAEVGRIVPTTTGKGIKKRVQ